ncbi:MAG TPA: SAM-dependent methyltransferase [Thermoplasmata archaeon]|nr:SAM-dependent methyltransferase [Thermoplasmata archaeon]
MPPAAPAGRSLPARGVAAALARAADADGFVPFDRFQEAALYAEPDGFYARARSPLGAGGDFYTAAHVHPIFGSTLARRLGEVLAAVDGERPVRVVEVGPGDGTLAAQLLAALRAAVPAPRPVEFAVVDRASARCAAVRERLAPLAARAGVGLRALSSVGADGPFAGAVVANELLDAQPTRRLRWDGSAWSELGARRVGDRWQEAVRAGAPPVPGPPLPSGVEPGTVVEVSPTAEAIVREVGDHLTDGAAIFLDYGGEERELLAGHPHGTLAGVRAHTDVPDPYADPGTVDLSTFVNFDRIRAAARGAGLIELAYRRQAEALGAWGFEAEREAALRAATGPEAEVRVRLAAKSLLFGFDRFRALEVAAPATAARLARPT